VLKKIGTNLNWTYPFAELAVIEAKQSVSSIVHGETEYAQYDMKYSFSSFRTQDKSQRLLVGSATHLVMKNINLQGEINKSSIQKTIDDLAATNCISRQTADMIDIASIQKFFESDLGKILLDKKNTVMREWPFTYAAPVADLHPGLKNCTQEKIIIQGIIDVLVQTPTGGIIIDFKTDKIDSADVRQRAEDYAPQLKWYCRAAGEILDLKDISGWLYFLNAESACRVI